MLLSASAPARNRRAVILTTDARGTQLAQFVAWRIAKAEPVRDYDICVCTLGEALPLAHPGLPEIRACAVDPEPFEGVRTGSKWPAETYLKHYLPVLFAQDYDQIVYLDTDVMPLDTPLSRLFAEAVPGRAVSAVLAVSNWRQKLAKQTVAYHNSLGLRGQAYCNAGVLVFDVAACISSDLWGRMIAESGNRPQRFRLYDQSLLNSVLQGDWAPLSLRWNWQMYAMPARLAGRARPHLLHFLGNSKPYIENPANLSRPYRKDYEDFFLQVLGQPMPVFAFGHRNPKRAWPRRPNLSNVIGFLRARLVHLTMLDQLPFYGAIPAMRLWQSIRKLEAERESTGRYAPRTD